MLHSRSPDGFAIQATTLGLERSLEPVADWQQMRTMALGAIGLVLAVPILAALIVLVREIYSYDVLKLRNIKVKV